MQGENEPQGKKGEREYVRDKQQRRHFFWWKNKMTFLICSCDEKIRNANGHQCKVKLSGSETDMYDFSSIKSVTKKFVEVSRCSRAKQRQKNVQKRCAARAKLLFC